MKLLLREILGDGVASPEKGEQLDTHALRAALGERIRGDFAHGKLVQVDGWYLSATEVRVCAHLCLLERDQLGPAATG